MAKYHITTQPGTAAASSGQRTAIKKPEAGLTTPMGERRGAEGDGISPLGAGAGTSTARQRPYGSESPGQSPSRDSKGLCPAGAAGGKQVSPHRAWLSGGQGRAAQHTAPLF